MPAPVSPEQVREELRECLADLQAAAALRPGQVLVVGASTSELAGHPIGTHTSVALGQAVVDEVLTFCREIGCYPAFQCCEHLNRALVVAQSVASARGWTEVAAVPVPGAGGAVAACAYQAMEDARLVERVVADAGIDLGGTLIGMHLRPVAVPLRGRRRWVGQAYVTLARTRPPLVGGPRTVYDAEEARRRLQQAISPAGAADKARESEQVGAAPVEDAGFCS
ncbi:MAG: TIGR01440 family protein [Alicyclobacillus sp.]|nr:TIGR01440 family protein [Alicyclobacillus sp.]